jgi:hypothetical protein
VALIVGITKFTIGAWVPIVVVPLVILLFRSIKRHYQRFGAALAITPEDVRREDFHHTVVVLVGRVHRGVITALNYARSMRPDHVLVLYVASDDEERQHMEAEWKRFGFDVPLEIVYSRYRDLVAPVETYLDDLDERWRNDMTTIVIPEVVVGTASLANLLHGQSALALKLALIDRPNTVVTSVPFHPTGPSGGPPGSAQGPSGTAAGSGEGPGGGSPPSEPQAPPEPAPSQPSGAL